MRKFQWNKIPVNKVIGGDNVWTAVGERFQDYKLDFATMEDLFAVAQPQLAEKKDSVDGADKKKKSDEVSSSRILTLFLNLDCILPTGESSGR
jgi:hypothetical protein